VYLILRDIAKEYNSPDEFSREEIINLTSHLVVTLLRNLGAVNVVNSRDAVISEVVAFIKENYRTNITLSQLAEMHFISPEHLSRSFKKETNFGFNEFIALVRLQQAEMLLKNRGNMSIAEVAYACGYNDSNYFSDKFKRTYGISPLQYSKAFKIGKSQSGRGSRKKKKRSDEAAE
jgi:AraC-like DNA-binding protein